MPSIHFDITADNAEFLTKIHSSIVGLSQTRKAADAAGVSFDELLSRFAKAAEGMEGNTRELTSVVKDSTKAVKNEYDKVSADVATKYNQAMDSMAEKTNELKEATQDAAGSIKNGFMQALGFAGVDLSLDGIKTIAEKLFETRSYFQDIESSMKTFLGSEEKAVAFTEELQKYAYYNQFEFSELAQGSSQLIAYGNDVKNVIPILDHLSNIAAATHAPLNEMINLYNRAKSTGVVDGQALESWSTKGLIVKDVLKDMGQSASSSSITFEQLNDVLEHVTSEGGQFYGQMDNMFDNLSSEMGGLEDNLDLMFNEIGQTIQEPLREIIHTAAEATGEWQRIGEVLLELAVVYGTYRTALLLSTAATKASTVIAKQEVTIKTLLAGTHTAEATSLGLATIAKNAWTVATNYATIAALKLNAAILANPYVAAATAVAALTVAVYELYTSTQDYTTELEKMNAAEEEFNETQKESSQLLSEVKKAMDDENTSSSEKNRLMDEFRRRFPDTAKKYQTWIDLQKNLAAATREANSELAKQANAHNTKLYDDEINKLKELRRLRSLYLNRGNLSGSERDELSNLMNKYQKQANQKRGMSDIVGGLDKLIAESSEAINKKAGEVRKQKQEKLLADIDKMDSEALKKYIENTEKQMDILRKSGKKYIILNGETVATSMADLSARLKSAQKAQKEYLDNANKDYIADAKKRHNEAKKALEKFQKDYIDPTTGKRVKNDEEAQAVAKRLKVAVANAKSDVESYGASTNEKKSKSGKTAEQKAKEQAQREQRLADEILKQDEDIESKRQQLAIKTQQARIDQMKDGSAKVLAQIHIDYKKQMSEIDQMEKDMLRQQEDAARKRWELQNPKASEKGLNWKNSGYAEWVQGGGNKLSEEQITYLTELRNLARSTRDKSLSKADFQAIAEGIDWRGLLGDLGSLGEELYKPMLDKLEAYLKTDEYKSSSIEDKQKVSELINSLRQYVDTDVRKTYGDLANVLADFKKAQEDYNGKKLASDEAQASLTKAEADLKAGKITKEAYDKIAESTENASIEMQKASENLQELGLVVSQTTDAVKNPQTKLLTSLNKAKGLDGVEGFSNIKAEIINFTQLEGSLDIILSKMGDGMAKNIGEGISNVMSSIGDNALDFLSEGIGGIISIVAQIPKMILSVADAIKNFVTGILDSISTLLKFEWLKDLVVSILDSIGNIIDTILDLPENLAHLLEGIVVNGVGGLVNSVLGRVGNILSFGALDSGGPAEWFTNSNSKEVNQITERNTKAIEHLSKSIEYFNKSFDNANGVRAVEITQQMIDVQKEINSLNAETLKAQMGYHDAHHSNNYYADDNEVRRLYLEGVKRASQLSGVDMISSIKGIGDVESMSPEQLNAIRTYMPELWEYLTTVGEYNKSEYWDAVADQAGKVEDLVSKLNDKLTMTSFDSLRENFLDTLTDMESSAEEFSESLEKMMFKAMINSFVLDDEFDKWLNDWQSRYAKAIQENNASALESLREEAMSMRDNKVAQRNQYANYMGYGDNSSQTATANGIQNITADQADQLIGRVTAMQIAVESGRENNEKIANGISSIVSSVSSMTSNNGILDDIRRSQALSTSYLETIERFTKNIYNDFIEKLDSIKINTSRL